MPEPIDSKTRRQLRQKLGSRVGRRAVTKMRTHKGGASRAVRPRARLAEMIEQMRKG